MELPFTSTFNVEETTLPYVSSITPSDGLVVPAPFDAAVGIIFSEAVNPQTVVGSNLWIVNECDGRIVPASVTSDGNDKSKASIMPNEPLSESCEGYTVHVKDIRDSVGNVMELPFTSTFNVEDNTPPEVSATNPDNGINIADYYNGPTYVYFNELVDPSSINDATIGVYRIDEVWFDKGKVICVNVQIGNATYDPAENRAVISYSETIYRRGSDSDCEVNKYEIRVNNVADTTGNIMTTPYQSYFNILYGG